MQIFAATSNSGKLRDFAQAASADGVEVLPLPGLAGMPEPVEDAPDFVGNAALKAIAYSRLAPGLLVLADDSGLEVDALGSQPGVRSARFADDMNFQPDTGLTKDERNNCCLLSMLGDVNVTTNGRAGRHARFVCEIAVARDGVVLYRATGEVEGEVLESPRGADGFGYDPLFLTVAHSRTLAELTPVEKWQVSHRGRAFRALLGELRSSPLTADHKIAHPER